MKTRLLLLLAGFLALLTTVATAQCPAGDITLTNQADVDAFPSNYPGCTTVQGNLTIQHTDITNLDSLHYITHVTGGVRIFSNNALTTLSGLKNLTDVDGYFYITANPSLKTLSGLDNLATVGGLMAIQNNIALTTLSNLQSLKMISGGLSIENNSSLTTLQGLEQNTTIGGSLVILANLKLTTLSGLENLSSVGGRLTINSNLKLITLSDLENLSSVGGSLIIKSNSKLTTLSGLENLSSVGGSLHIINNAKLTTLSVLNNISSLGGDLFINGNDALTTLSGLDNISSLDGELYIYSNNALTTLSGLDNITSVGGELTIRSNPKLTTLSGLDNITSVGGILSITSNLKLTTLSGLENIDPTTITELTIQNNPSLSFCDLPNICTYLAGSGPRTISGNSGTCADEMAVNMACLPEVVQIIAPASITAPCGSLAEDLDLPTNVQVALDDQSTTTIAVTWDVSAYDGTAGTHILPGTLDLMEQATNPGSLTTMLTVVVGSEGAPVMECGESHLVTCDPVVTFDLPVATDQCGPVQVVQTDRTGLTPGSTFPVGTTVLSYRATGTGGTATCTIEVEVLPPLEVNHVAGIAEGDTLHIPTCIPPPIDKRNLDVGLYEPFVSVGGRMFSEDLPSAPIPGMWKINSHEYTVRSVCGTTAQFQHYVALYDLAPPVFRGFPADTTITSVGDLPPVPGEVESLDLCRFVVWDTVTTTAVMDPGTGDTIAFVRRWMAEDEVGNKSFRDQMIYISPFTDEVFGSISAHVVKESDLIHARFPESAGTDGVPVTLYRIDSATNTAVAVATHESGNWQGQHGNVVLTPVIAGQYQLKIEVPPGYSILHIDSLFSENGWSDTLTIAGGTELALGSILLIPDVDTLAVDTLLPISQTTEIFTPLDSWSGEDFSVYPNPTSGLFKIGWKIGETAEYKIFNHLGQLVQTGTVDNGQEIDLSASGTGIYFIQFRNGLQDLGSKRIILIGR